jgi:MFS family permease
MAAPIEIGRPAERGSAAAAARSWRTPVVILLCGCAIGVLGFGPRVALAFFLTPISSANGWGRDVMALALAIQMLLWGAGQPIAGALADRFGAPWVLGAGAVVYAIGLAAMAQSTTPAMLHLTAGVVIGFGLAGSSFMVVLGAFGKLLPGEWRGLAFGAGTAAGSFGQFLYSPLAVALIDRYGWQQTLVIFAAVTCLIIPFATALAAPRAERRLSAGDATTVPSALAREQSAAQALAEAFGHRSFILLMLGYFTCGFQTFFMGVHLPAYLVDRGLPAEIGGWSLAVIGLFNLVGSLGAGWLSGLVPKRLILAFIYFARSVTILVLIMVPLTPAITMVFSAVLGLLWLSTIPPTSSLVAVMFGTRWLTMLFGFVFFGHQLGGFLGVWLGGFLFERTGSYDTVWWIAILLGILSALVNLPIVEKPIARVAAAPA